MSTNSSPGRLTTPIFGVLVAVLLSLSGWTLSQVHQVGGDLAVIRQIVADSKESRLTYQAAEIERVKMEGGRNEEAHRRIETAVMSLISRPEFEAKLATIEIQLKGLKADLEDIRMRSLALEARMKDL